LLWPQVLDGVRSINAEKIAALMPMCIDRVNCDFSRDIKAVSSQKESASSLKPADESNIIA
jgi:hypothetical protein